MQLSYTRSTFLSRYNSEQACAGPEGWTPHPPRVPAADTSPGKAGKEQSRPQWRHARLVRCAGAKVTEGSRPMRASGLRGQLAGGVGGTSAVLRKSHDDPGC